SEESLAKLIDEMAACKTPRPCSQIGRFASEPASGLSSLTDVPGEKTPFNGSVQRAVEIGDTLKRIDGTEVPLRMPWQMSGQAGPIGVMGAGQRPMSAVQQAAAQKAAAPKPAKGKPADKTGVTVQEAQAVSKGVPASKAEPAAASRPKALKAARKGGADDLKMIKGVGPKLEKLLNSLGFFHFDQVAAWTAAELAWVDENLEGFKGRASRDDWVAQAKLLAGGGETAFSAKAKKDGIYDA
ncbi:MAG: fused NADH-quinone oxidoreductase subunit E/endonuclease, partial [Rhodobacteraceae bacterium]|nr:fused NADH-quinone oxidoreductase subunit E/endonuclease [Paracoccaceae bacterium]